MLNLNFRSPDIFPILIHSFPPSSRFSETKKEYSETKRSRNDSFSWLTGYQSRQQDQTWSRNSDSQKVFLNLIFNVERCLKFQVQNLAKAVGSNSKRLAPILRTQKAQKVRAAALARPGTKTIKPFCHTSCSIQSGLDSNILPDYMYTMAVIELFHARRDGTLNIHLINLTL